MMRSLPVACNAGAGAGALHCRAANAASAVQQNHRTSHLHRQTGPCFTHGSARHPQREPLHTAAVAERLEASAAQPRLANAALEHEDNQHVREGYYEAELVKLQVRNWRIIRHTLPCSATGACVSAAAPPHPGTLSGDQTAVCKACKS